MQVFLTQLFFYIEQVNFHYIWPTWGVGGGGMGYEGRVIDIFFNRFK